MLAIDFWRRIDQHGSVHREARDRSFVAFAERGCYPPAHAHPGAAWSEVPDQLDETVIRHVIQHDLRVVDRGLRPTRRHR